MVAERCNRRRCGRSPRASTVPLRDLSRTSEIIRNVAANGAARRPTTRASVHDKIAIKLIRDPIGATPGRNYDRSKECHRRCRSDMRLAPSPYIVHPCRIHRERLRHQWPRPFATRMTFGKRTSWLAQSISWNGRARSLLSRASDICALRQCHALARTCQFTP